MYPFPIVLNNERIQIEEGMYFDVPNFCKKNFNHKCKAHYESVNNSKGFHLCPYGFSTYIYEVNGAIGISTCLNIKGHSVENKIKKMESHKENFPLFSKDQITNIIQKHSLLIGSYEVEKNTNFENRLKIKKATFEHNIITNTLHELRKLNQQIKLQSEVLQSEVNSITCKGEFCKKLNILTEHLIYFLQANLLVQG